VIALGVIAVALPTTGEPGHHTIDYLGTVLLAAAATSVVLFTTLGGSVYAWGSAPILMLAGAFVVLVIGFLIAEQHAAEPVLPLELFRYRVFSLACSRSIEMGLSGYLCVPLGTSFDCGKC